MKHPQKHINALKKLYKDHGVGSKISQKFAFWESQHPHGYSISHITTQKGKVLCFEEIYLLQKFPKDFIFC